MNFNLAQVFQFLSVELDRFLKDTSRPTGYAGIADPTQLHGDVEFLDSNAKNRVSVALVNVLGEAADSRDYLIMVFAAFKSYELAIARISRVQDFFQENQHLGADAGRQLFPADTVHRIVFEPYFPTTMELQNIWLIHGGRYFPSVFYKMKIQLG